MKNFLRIAIVVVILLVMGVATYIAFFKPANKDEVYLELSKLSSVEQELNVGLTDISASKFSPAVKVAGVDTGFTQEIVNAYNNALTNNNNRKLLTNGNALVNSRVSYQVAEDEAVEYEINQYSYPKLKNHLDEVFNYYYAYSQAVNKTVPKKQLDTMKGAIKSYKASVDDVNAKLKSIYNLQTYINEHPTENLSLELDNRYKSAVISFRGLINNYAKLIESTKNFVTTYVFKGEMLTDKDSLLYDMMIKSVVSATNSEYSYSDYELRRLADENMDSATKFVTLAMAEDKNAQINNTYRFESGTVVYNNIAYNKSTIEFKSFDIELRIGEDDALYYGDTNYKFLSNGSYIANHETGVVEFIVNYSSDGQTETAISLDPIQFTLKDGEYCKTISLIYDDANVNRVYFNLGENSIVNNIARRFVNIVGYQDGNVKIQEGKVQIPVIDASNSSIKSYLRFDYDSNIINYYLINGNYYKLAADNSVINIDNNSYTLVGATYYATTFYSHSKLGMSTPEALNYRQMVKCYNKIMKNNPEQIDMLIALTNQEKRLFVNGDTSVKVEFLETYYEELGYILACYGFTGEVA